MSWEKVKLKKVLKQYRIEIRVKDDIEYKQVTISKHTGVKFRGTKTGKNIGRKRQFLIDLVKYPKTLMLVRQGVFDGAIGIAPKEVNGCIATENMPMFSVENIDIDFLTFILKSSYFKDLLKKIPTTGSAQKSIHERLILELEIPYPELSEQRKIVDLINNRNSNVEDITTRLTHQLTLVKKLRQSFLREAMQGKLLKSSPPLKEGWPKAGVVDDKLNRFPQKEVVDKKINNLPYLKTFRKDLRNNLTPAEAKLWTLIKGKRLEGRKFRRQFSVANYILDFYCPSENLAIELDGQGHFEASQAEYDYERDLFLNNYGIKVLRFENKWVWDNPEGLLEEIKRNFGWKENDPSVLRTAPLEGEQLETGADLLAKIKAEKVQLIKDKKIKKQNPLLPITKEEIPFEIPENWVWCRLGDIIYNTEGGKSPKCKNEPASGKNWGVIKTTAVQEMIFLEIENKILPSNFIVQENHKVFEGDVLITRAGPKNRVGVVCCVENLTLNLILSDKTIRILFNKKLLKSKFIAYSLNSPLIKPVIERKMTGMADSQVNISQDNMKGFPIPLPPLPEQKRIVAKLDELMAYCDSLEASIKNSQKQNEMLLGQVLREALEPK